MAIKRKKIKRNKNKSKFSNFFDFNPSVTFFGLPIVRYSSLLIIIIAIIMAYLAIKNAGPLKFDFSEDGYKTFLQLFKFPIWILAMLAPMLALFAANHRSSQTLNVISVNENQNIFSNYFKHIEEFEKYLANNCSLNKIKIDNVRTFHKYLFPEARTGKLFLGEAIKDDFNILCDHILGALNNWRNKEFDTHEDLLEIFELKAICEEYLESEEFQFSWGLGNIIHILDDKEMSIMNTVLQNVSEIKQLVKDVHQIYSFDSNYKANASTILITKLSDDGFRNNYLANLSAELVRKKRINRLVMGPDGNYRYEIKR